MGGLVEIEQQKQNECTGRACGGRQSPYVLHFSQPWTPNQSIRRRELDMAARRSHAAKLTRRKRATTNIQASADASGGGVDAIPRRNGATRTVTEHPSQKDSRPLEGCPEPLTSESPSEYRSPPFIHGTECHSPDPPPPIKGNSDPFDSFVVRVDPHINRMISFARDSYYPALALVPWLQKYRKANDKLRYFELGRSRDCCKAAHLASFGAALVRLLPERGRAEIETAWLRVRGLALQKLQNSLTSQSRTSDVTEALTQQCLYLFQTDTEARLFSGALMHGQTLRGLFLKTAPNSTVIYLFLSAMHTVAQNCTLQLNAPIMTYDDWHPDMWHSLWTQAEGLLESCVLLKPLHNSITPYPHLSSALFHLRLALAPYSHELDSSLNASYEGERSKMELISLWSATRLVNDSLRLWTHFVSLCKLLDSLHHLPSRPSIHSKTVRTRFLWDAVLTLTTVVSIRAYINSPHVDGSAIGLRDASMSIAPRYLQLVADLLGYLTEEERGAHGEVLLWVLFTGATYEQRHTDYRRDMLLREHVGSIAKTDISDVNMHTNGSHCWWFSRSLARHAEITGLSEWDDARVVLETFTYGHGLFRPTPENWWCGMFLL
jgi:hypothetical protein